MKFLNMFGIVFLISIASLNAQDKPAGKISGYMFGDYYYNAARDTSFANGSLSNAATGGARDLNGVQLRRIYFTYDNDISEKFTSRFRLEADQAANASNGKIGVFVKDAYLKWKGIFEGSDFAFGVQPTPAYDISEAAWGYRSLEKTIMDLRGIVPSRDLAVSLRGRIDGDGNYNYWLMLGDNSGNTPETDKYKRYYLNLQAKPSANFQATVYGDFASRPTKTALNNNNNQSTFAGFMDYGEKDKYNFGVEAFMQMTANDFTVSGVTKTRNALGLTVYGSVNVDPDVALVARYDYYDPNMDDASKGDARNYFIGALSWKADKNVMIQPNVLVETYESAPNGGKSYDASITARLTFYYIFL